MVVEVGGAFSKLSPECTPKQTSTDHPEFMPSRPGLACEARVPSRAITVPADGKSSKARGLCPASPAGQAFHLSSISVCH
jgi:hypothetical protein